MLNKVCSRQTAPTPVFDIRSEEPHIGIKLDYWYGGLKLIAGSTSMPILSIPIEVKFSINSRPSYQCFWSFKNQQPS